MNDLPSDLAELLDHGIVERAREAYQGAHTRIAELRVKLRIAEAALQTAVAARRELTRRTAAGETIPQREVAEAEVEIREREQEFKHFDDAIAHLDAQLPSLDQAIQEAQRAVWRPVVVEAVRRRFDAGARLRAAQAVVHRIQAELHTANSVISRANAAGLPMTVPLVDALAGAPNPDKERALWLAVGVKVS